VAIHRSNCFVAGEQEHLGGVKDYCAAEGKLVQVPCKGPAERVLREVTGGLRSACAYVIEE
jgi:GMP reductase